MLVLYGVWYRRRKEKTTLYLTPQLRRALTDMAQRTKRPQAAIVRDALLAYIAAAPRTKLRSLGAGEDPEVSGATSEAYLRVKLRRN
ncbi:MAG: CopG family transcriptional regulator [Candidatus Eremiobacteraeota bacterium]|nr:CopG family transcriptional regulator [Candidatus Eremiobacteraeota bacterium]